MHEVHSQLESLFPSLVLTHRQSHAEYQSLVPAPRQVVVQKTQSGGRQGGEAAPTQSIRQDTLHSPACTHPGMFESAMSRLRIFVGPSCPAFTSRFTLDATRARKSPWPIRSGNANTNRSGPSGAVSKLRKPG